jgi:hypothetical protein
MLIMDQLVVLASLKAALISFSESVGLLLDLPVDLPEEVFVGFLTGFLLGLWAGFFVMIRHYTISGLILLILANGLSLRQLPLSSTVARHHQPLKPAKPQPLCLQGL